MRAHFPRQNDIREMNIKETWSRCNPIRRYTGDRILGEPACVLNEFPIRPKGGDIIIDYEKWQFSIYKNGQWHILSLDVLPFRYYNKTLLLR
jgi:hypothetical protein